MSDQLTFALNHIVSPSRRFGDFLGLACGLGVRLEGGESDAADGGEHDARRDLAWGWGGGGRSCGYRCCRCRCRRRRSGYWLRCRGGAGDAADAVFAREAV